MKRKILLALVLAAIATGGVFAQTDFGSLPKNTLTVDLGPTIIGATVEALGRFAGDGADDLTSGFGIAVQYERQLFKHLSVAGRFAYLRFGLGFEAEADDGAKALLDLDLTSFSVEGHVRYYPFGQTFFLNGMAGYGRISMPFSGEADFTDEYGNSGKETFSINAARNYVKYGGKLGWRIDFGKPRGFVFEPSFGYYGRLGLGDTLWKKFADSFEENSGEVMGGNAALETMFSLLEQFILIGGPRFSLSFGWRF